MAHANRVFPARPPIVEVQNADRKRYTPFQHGTESGLTRDYQSDAMVVINGTDTGRETRLARMTPPFASHLAKKSQRPVEFLNGG